MVDFKIVITGENGMIERLEEIFSQIYIEYCKTLKEQHLKIKKKALRKSS